VVVLGAPVYYGRFGFHPASAWRLGNEYCAGDEFMPMELEPGGIPAEGGLRKMVLSQPMLLANSYLNLLTALIPSFEKVEIAEAQYGCKFLSHNALKAFQ
jgi:hypothetical protein